MILIMRKMMIFHFIYNKHILPLYSYKNYCHLINIITEKFRNYKYSSEPSMFEIIIIVAVATFQLSDNSWFYTKHSINEISLLN